MPSNRLIKYNRQLQKDIAEIFTVHRDRYFKGVLATTTEAEVTPDLKSVRIYVAIFPTTDAERYIENLNENKPEIRNLLAKRIKNRVRIIPELLFVLDMTGNEAAKINALLNQINLSKK